MKINGNSSGSIQVPGSGSGATSRTGAAGRQTSSSPVSGSSAGTPAAAARLSQLEAQFSQSDFNASQVNAISAAIANGSYQVNSGAIADKLLETTAALAGKRGPSS